MGFCKKVVVVVVVVVAVVVEDPTGPQNFPQFSG